jgi:hypothetical protein
VLRVYGVPVSSDDAHKLVVRLMAYGSPDAVAAAARIRTRLQHGAPRGLVALEPQQRDAILDVLEDPPEGLAELRGKLVDDAAKRDGFDRSA